MYVREEPSIYQDMCVEVTGRLSFYHVSPGGRTQIPQAWWPLPSPAEPSLHPISFTMCLFVYLLVYFFNALAGVFSTEAMLVDPRPFPQLK